MRPHRVYVPKITPEVRVWGREARHLLEVLRARVGDTVTVFDGQGLEGRAVLAAVEEGAAHLRVEETWSTDREVGVPVVLYAALLKGDKLADVLRAVTELGVTRFTPLITERSIPKEMDSCKKVG